METTTDINKLISAIKENCPEIVISQLTSFGEKPFESGVWKFWHRDNENVHINIEVQNGLLLALYSNKEFEDKHPISAVKICEFLDGFSRI